MKPVNGHTYSFDDLQAFHDGLVAPDRAAALEQHIRVCSECRVAMERLARLDQALAAPDLEPVPEKYFETFSSRVASRIAARETEPSKAFVFRWNWLKATVAASAGLVVIVSILLLQTHRPAVVPRHDYARNNAKLPLPVMESKPDFKEPPAVEEPSGLRKEDREVPAGVEGIRGAPNRVAPPSSPPAPAQPVAAQTPPEAPAPAASVGLDAAGEKRMAVIRDATSSTKTISTEETEGLARSTKKETAGAEVTDRLQADENVSLATKAPEIAKTAEPSLMVIPAKEAKNLPRAITMRFGATDKDRRAQRLIDGKGKTAGLAAGRLSTTEPADKLEPPASPYRVVDVIVITLPDDGSACPPPKSAKAIEITVPKS